MYTLENLILTCYTCPEQYDIYDSDGNNVAYLRLRHGVFTVECPDVGGKIVLREYPEGDGRFLEKEREEYLNIALEAINQFYK